MKKSIFLLFLCLSTFIQAQIPYASFPTSADKPVWNEVSAAKTCLIGDTLINDKTYSILWNDENCTNPLPTGIPEFAIREEDKRVFLYDFELQRETKLYDFNLTEIGDTVRTEDHSKEYFIQLLDTAQVEMLDGSLRKSYYIGFINEFTNEYGYTSSWIEGVGDGLGVLYDEVNPSLSFSPPYILEYGTHQVLCMKFDSATIYQLTPFIACDSLVQPEPVGIEIFNEMEISVYPNPTTKTITFSFPLLEKNTQLKIYDGMGNLLTEIDLKQGITQKKMDVSKMKRGICFWKIGHNNGKMLLH